MMKFVRGPSEPHDACMDKSSKEGQLENKCLVKVLVGLLSTTWRIFRVGKQAQSEGTGRKQSERSQSTSSVVDLGRLEGMTMHSWGPKSKSN